MAALVRFLNTKFNENPLINRLFIITAWLHLFAALVILGNEMMVEPGQYFHHHPIEHKSSWMRVILFICVALLSVFMTWLMKRSKPSGRSLPLILVLPIAALLMLLGTSVHYISILGWCCEPITGFLFGFPFSFVYAISGKPLADLEFASNYGVYDLLSNPGLNIIGGWWVDFSHLLLDFLFWLNAAVVILSLISWLIRKGRLQQPMQKDVTTPLV